MGKESDIFEVTNENGDSLVLKLHRLGRTSFRAVKQKRDYLQGRQSASFLYMSRLAALREFAYMKALYAHGFPTPTPVDHNRHCIIMSRVDGFPFTQVREIVHAPKVYAELMNLIVRLAEHGLIHGDFNEFNLLINDDEVVTMIDFPQMVSTQHPNAQELFDRDVDGVRAFFRRKIGFESEEYPRFTEDTERVIDLDEQLKCSGVTRDEMDQFQEFMLRNQLGPKGEASSDDEEESEDEDGSDAEESGEDEDGKDKLAGDAEDVDGAADAGSDDEDGKEPEIVLPDREKVRATVRRQYGKKNKHRRTRNGMKSKSKRKLVAEIKTYK